MREELDDLVDMTTGEVHTKTKRATPWRPRLRLSKTFSTQGRTHQEFKEQCDINTIVRRWRNTGELPHLNTAKPWYGDFTAASDYQDARNRIDAAESAFMELPSSVRSACDNDPAKLIELAYGDPSGRKTLEDAGLQVQNRDGPQAGADYRPPEAAGEGPTDPPKLEGDTPS